MHFTQCRIAAVEVEREALDAEGRKEKTRGVRGRTGARRCVVAGMPTLWCVFHGAAVIFPPQTLASWWKSEWRTDGRSRIQSEACSPPPRIYIRQTWRPVRTKLPGQLSACIIANITSHKCFTCLWGGYFIYRHRGCFHYERGTMQHKCAQ